MHRARPIPVIVALVAAHCSWFAAEPGPPAERRCDVEDRPGCFVRVPGATFLLGAQSGDPEGPNHDPDAAPNEGPVREVTVASFWMQRDAYTARAYAACVKDGACPPDAHGTGGYANYGRREHNDHPMNSVRFDGAVAACAQLGGRLPTEAEWTLAASGPTHRRWPWGDTPGCGVLPTDNGGAQGKVIKSDDRVMAQPPCASDGTVSVRDMRGMSPHGVRGMAGNVWEWTGSTPADASPSDKPRRIQRGGGWTSSDPLELRTTARVAMPEDVIMNDVGFRCVWGSGS